MTGQEAPRSVVAVIEAPDVDLGVLRQAIQAEYAEVADHPDQGFHFHTGRKLAGLLGYQDAWLEGIPESSIESFAGTGNPFSIRELSPGEWVVDIGSGAGIDSLIAARMVGPTGRVVGVDMTPAMLEKARIAAADALQQNVEFREGYGEALPIEDEWADVLISNGVLNLMPDKVAAFTEMARVLKPGGRLQIGDILVQKAVPQTAKSDIALWTALPPELVQGLWDEVSPHAEEWRAIGVFPAAVPVPADAPLLDRLLGLTGRDPAA